MKTSNKGIALIQHWERCKLKAYRCSAGKLTIGWGHTAGVKAGDVITQEQADAFLAEDLEEREAFVRNISMKLNQNQFDSLVSLVYNIGAGNFMRSPVRPLVERNPNNLLIANAFMMHVYANGTHDGIDNDGDGLVDEPGEYIKLDGLISRRKEEVQLYFSTK